MENSNRVRQKTDELREERKQICLVRTGHKTVEKYKKEGAEKGKE